MKRLLYVVACITTSLISACSLSEIEELSDRVDILENKISELEAWCKEINSDISTLQKIVEAIQNNDYIIGITPIVENRVEIGYKINFAKSEPIFIYHGEDGEDGEDGYTPVVSIKQSNDGLYYWIIDGEWLLDDEGNKVKAQGTDGEDGNDGEAGSTPELKIEEDWWYVSYDGGINWIRLGKATGEDGENGNTLFSGIDASNPEYIIISLSDGAQIQLPTWTAYTNLVNICNQMNSNITAMQTMIDALESKDWITEVAPIIENDKVIGYRISFDKSDSITIYHGENGEDGSPGRTPYIGLQKDSDGLYYWTMDGAWIVDSSGAKVRASGFDATAPQLKISDGYWYISYDNGNIWQQLDKAVGDRGQNGDSMFKSVKQDDNYVYFTLADGTIINIPKKVILQIEFNVPEILYMNTNSLKEITYIVTSGIEEVMVDVVASGDIKAKVNHDSDRLSGTISVISGNQIDDYCKILVFISNEERVLMRTIQIREINNDGSNDSFEENDDWGDLFN